MRIIGSTMSIYAALVIGIMAMPACCATAWAADLKDFTSDGCSLFPDGTMGDRAKWCECCLRHDIAYWRGGTEDERKEADERLRTCVFDRTGDRALAETMYRGVRAGGHPVFPTWYRWAYGWPYGRDYEPLSDKAQEAVRAKLADHTKDHPGGYCREKHGSSGTNDRGERK